MVPLPRDITPLVSNTRRSLVWSKMFAQDPHVYRRLQEPWTCSFWEIGNFEGVYVLSGIEQGTSAEIGIRLYGKSSRFRGDNGLPLHYTFGRFVFHHYNLQSLRAFINVNNTLSINLAKKIGFRHEGTLNRYTREGGQVVDMWVGAVMREDFL